MREYVVVPEISEILYIAEHLREADRQEIKAALGQSPREALVEGCVTAKACFMFRDPEGVPTGLFGIVEDPTGVGAVAWMVSTDGIERYSMTFLRRCRKWVATLLETYGTLWNYVDARNTVHVKWLRWMGFTLEGPVPYGYQGLPFYKLILRKE